MSHAIADTTDTDIRNNNEDLDRVFVFLLEALYEAVKRVGEGRHVGAPQLTSVVREIALEKYGVMARTVLGRWGINSTHDVGRLIFEMIDQGILMQSESDRLEDFADLFDFDEAFEADYPWSASVEEEVVL